MGSKERIIFGLSTNAITGSVALGMDGAIKYRMIPRIYGFVYSE